MSSMVRRIQLRLLRASKKLPERNKAIRRFKGLPFRHCKVTYDKNGNVASWVRYH